MKWSAKHLKISLIILSSNILQGSHFCHYYLSIYPSNSHLISSSHSHVSLLQRTSDEDNEGEFPSIGLHRPRCCLLRLTAHSETSVSVIDIRELGHQTGYCFHMLGHLQLLDRSQPATLTEVFPLLSRTNIGKYNKNKNKPANLAIKSNYICGKVRTYK